MNSIAVQEQLLEFSKHMSNLALASLESQDTLKDKVFDFNTANQVTFDIHTIVFDAEGMPNWKDSTTVATDSKPDSTKSAEIGIIIVAHRLKAAGLSDTNITKIFKNGITPTSLAAIESQLKGHHDAVLQIALETLTRVTQLMQKIAQKLSAS
jgi:hypothetical protein